jgi:hypothetical protein
VDEELRIVTVRYGWRTDDIEAVAGALSTALGIKFEPHDSFFLGDYYLWPPSGHARLRPTKLQVLPNFFDEFDQELTYPEYPEHGVLLDATDVPDEWTERILALPGTEVLKHPAR